MIDFSLTDEQELIREAARDFANNKIKPFAWIFNRILSPRISSPPLVRCTQLPNLLDAKNLISELSPSVARPRRDLCCQRIPPGNSSAEIITSQVDIDSESPPTQKRDKDPKNDSLIKHFHINKRANVSRNIAGGNVGITGVLVQKKRKSIQTVDDRACQEKSVSPHASNDQTESDAQEKNRVK